MTTGWLCLGGRSAPRGDNGFATSIARVAMLSRWVGHGDSPSDEGREASVTARLATVCVAIATTSIPRTAPWSQRSDNALTTFWLPLVTPRRYLATFRPHAALRRQAWLAVATNVGGVCVVIATTSIPRMAPRSQRSDNALTTSRPPLSTPWRHLATFRPHAALPSPRNCKKY